MGRTPIPTKLVTNCIVNLVWFVEINIGGKFSARKILISVECFIVYHDKDFSVFHINETSLLLVV